MPKKRASGPKNLGGRPPWENRAVVRGDKKMCFRIAPLEHELVKKAAATDDMDAGPWLIQLAVKRRKEQLQTKAKTLLQVERARARQQRRASAKT